MTDTVTCTPECLPLRSEKRTMPYTPLPVRTATAFLVATASLVILGVL